MDSHAIARRFRRLIRGTLLPTLFFGFTTLFAQAPEMRQIELSGKVLDIYGKPAKNAMVGSGWFRIKGVYAAGEYNYSLSARVLVRTDDQGRFKIKVPFRGEFPLCLGAYSEDQMDAIFMSIGEEDIQEELTLQLRQTKPVGVSSISVKNIDEFKSSPHIAIERTTDGLSLGAFQIDPKGDSLGLPPGQYEFTIRSIESEPLVKSVTIPGEGDGISLGNIELEPGRLAKRFGQPAPLLSLLDARGVPQDFQLSDVKGKWVVIEFWGYWCVPCVRRGIPELLSIYDKYAPNEKLQILAVHYNREEIDFEELDEKIKPFIDQFWGGRELPFPILLDQGPTAGSWGVRAFPTTLLVDPEGRLLQDSEKNWQRLIRDITRTD